MVQCQMASLISSDPNIDPSLAHTHDAAEYNFSLPASISQILGLQARPAAPCSSGDGTQGMLHG